MSKFATDLLNTSTQFRHSALEGAKKSAAVMELSSRRGTFRRIELVLEELLAPSNVDYLHIHFAAAGC